MFISKKKLEKMINDKAQVMADDRMREFWRNRDIEDKFHEFGGHMRDIDKRLEALEKELHPEKYTNTFLINGENVPNVPITNSPY